jgi:hypothetical protein
MLGSFKSDARTRSEFLTLIPPQGTRRWIILRHTILNRESPVWNLTPKK